MRCCATMHRWTDFTICRTVHSSLTNDGHSYLYWYFFFSNEEILFSFIFWGGGGIIFNKKYTNESFKQKNTKQQQKLYALKRNLYTQFFFKSFLENTFPQHFFLFKTHFKKKRINTLLITSKRMFIKCKNYKLFFEKIIMLNCGNIDKKMI